MPEKVVTGKVRMSYANVFEPKSINGSEPKYSVSILIPKSDKATINKIKTAINKVMEEGKNSKWGGKIPKKLKTPLRDGDEEREDDEAYADCFFINCNSTRAPKVVDKDLNPIIDDEEFYSGCYGKVSITLFAFSSNGSNGIGAGLNNIQKLSDGERLAGGSSPEEDFGNDFEDDDDDYLD